jgi:aminopeptidase N
VWQVIAIGLRGAGRLLDGAAYVAFQQRVATLVGPVLADLGWEPVAGEGELRAKLRGLLVSMLAVLGNDADAQARCRALLDRTGVDPELVSAATMAVAAVGTDADYERFLAAFHDATTPQEQLRFLYALAEFPEAEQIARTVEFAFSGEVRTQNAPFLLHRCLTNRWHGEAVWQSVRQRWDEANEKFPANTIVRMVDPVKMLTKPDLAADVQAFFAEHPIPQGGKGLDQILERQRTNAAMYAREHDRFAAALQD